MGFYSEHRGYLCLKIGYLKLLQFSSPSLE
jgi:hypothetical protein